MKINNILGEAIVRGFDKPASLLDGNNILWKVVDKEWIGKRSVWCIGNRACWLEDVKTEDVKSWWCGEDADYAEIFRRNDHK